MKNSLIVNRLVNQKVVTKIFCMHCLSESLYEDVSSKKKMNSRSICCPKCGKTSRAVVPKIIKDLGQYQTYHTNQADYLLKTNQNVMYKINHNKEISCKKKRKLFDDAHYLMIPPKEIYQYDIHLRNECINFVDMNYIANQNIDDIFTLLEEYYKDKEHFWDIFTALGDYFTEDDYINKNHKRNRIINVSDELLFSNVRVDNIERKQTEKTYQLRMRWIFGVQLCITADNFWFRKLYEHRTYSFDKHIKNMSNAHVKLYKSVRGMTYMRIENLMNSLEYQEGYHSLEFSKYYIEDDTNDVYENYSYGLPKCLYSYLDEFKAYCKQNIENTIHNSIKNLSFYQFEKDKIDMLSLEDKMVLSFYPNTYHFWVLSDYQIYPNVLFRNIRSKSAKEYALFKKDTNQTNFINTYLKQNLGAFEKRFIRKYPFMINIVLYYFRMIEDPVERKNTIDLFEQHVLSEFSKEFSKSNECLIPFRDIKDALTISKQLNKLLRNNHLISQTLLTRIINRCTSIQYKSSMYGYSQYIRRTTQIISDIYQLLYFCETNESITNEHMLILEKFCADKHYSVDKLEQRLLTLVYSKPEIINNEDDQICLFSNTQLDKYNKVFGDWEFQLVSSKNRMYLLGQVMKNCVGYGNYWNMVVNGYGLIVFGFNNDKKVLMQINIDSCIVQISTTANQSIETLDAQSVHNIKEYMNLIQSYNDIK